MKTMNLLDFSNTESVISANSFTDFEQLAELCPFTHGQGVYIARALYSLIDPLYEFVNICETDPNFAPKKKQITEKETKLTLYPNPASDILNFEIENYDLNEGLIVEISDIMGRLVKSLELVSKNTNNIDISDLKNGIYTISIKLNNGASLIEKLLIIK